MDREPCVYMLANRKRGTLYTGVTSNLLVRVHLHKTKQTGGFTARYAVDRLVWYEWHEVMETAIWREKNIKEWKRDWKVELIEKDNPDWRDLYPDIVSYWTGGAPEIGRTAEH